MIDKLKTKFEKQNRSNQETSTQRLIHQTTTMWFMNMILGKMVFYFHENYTIFLVNNHF